MFNQNSSYMGNNDKYPSYHNVFENEEAVFMVPVMGPAIFMDGSFEVMKEILGSVFMEDHVVDPSAMAGYDRMTPGFYKWSGELGILIDHEMNIVDEIHFLGGSVVPLEYAEVVGLAQKMTKMTRRPEVRMNPLAEIMQPDEIDSLLEG